jgi:zinc transport system substrate-binding protein
MNKRYYVILVVLIVIMVIGSAYYISTRTPTPKNETIGVVVTIVPQVEFVEKIGGNKVSVTILVPPGASPHTYEPTPSQMQEVAQAEMYVKVGSGIEFELVWMDKIIETNPAMLVVNCSDGIKLIDMKVAHEHKSVPGYENIGKDPHIWLSPLNAVIMVYNIYEGLVKIDPDNENYYAKNKDVYIEDLKELDKMLGDTFSNLKNKKFMVYHPAWGYLAYEYGLEQIPIEEEGKEPTPEGLIHLIDQAREHDIKVVFATPEFETETAETVADEISGSVVLISPLAKEYIDNLKKIAEEISRASQ